MPNGVPVRSTLPVAPVIGLSRSSLLFGWAGVATDVSRYRIGRREAVRRARDAHSSFARERQRCLSSRSRSRCMESALSLSTGIGRDLHASARRCGRPSGLNGCPCSNFSAEGAPRPRASRARGRGFETRRAPLQDRPAQARRWAFGGLEPAVRRAGAELSAKQRRSPCGALFRVPASPSGLVVLTGVRLGLDDVEVLVERDGDEARVLVGVDLVGSIRVLCRVRWSRCRPWRRAAPPPPRPWPWRGHRRSAASGSGCHGGRRGCRLARRGPGRSWWRGP
jgi:hypothetical protein